MDAIFELAPDITDTQESRSAMIRDAQQFALANKADDDFLVVPSEKNELFEESSSIFTIDGKNIEFDYISSINKNGNFVSFAQDPYGLWWWFMRTGIASGSKLKGPFSTKDKLIKSMGELYA